MKLTFTGLLFLLFLGLKLTGHITWSWIWVAAPLWAPLAIIVIVCGLIGIGIGFIKLIEFKYERSKK